jgi:hypothetical protein
MGSLIGAGVARDLEDAYQQAIWADAELSSQLTKAQQERAQRAAADQHRAAVNRARTQRPASRPATPADPSTMSTQQLLEHQWSELGRHSGHVVRDLPAGRVRPNVTRSPGP